MRLLKNLDEEVFLHEGIAYDVVRGGTAFLLVNVESWKAFIATRKRVPGT